jgi:predicted PurR-regulated permease PerM
VERSPTSEPAGARFAWTPAWLLLGALAAGSVFLSWRLLQPFANVILWSGVLALIFAPLNRRLLAKTGRPNLSAAVTLTVAIVAVLLPLGLISLAVAGEVGDLIDSAPAKWNEWLGDPTQQERLRGWRNDLAQRFPMVERIDSAKISTSLAGLGEALAKGSVGAVGALLRGAVSVVFIAFSLFFLLRDRAFFRKGLCRLLPLSPRQSDELIATTSEVIRASVLGVLVVALIQGGLGGVTFAILGLPSPFLWGVVMAFFALIPLVGAGAVWVPATILLLATGEPGKALALGLVGMLLISTIDNFLRPRLVGDRTGLHELVVFFAVLGGLKLFGLVGLLIGPAIFSVAWALLELFRNREPWLRTEAVEKPEPSEAPELSAAS